MILVDSLVRHLKLPSNAHNFLLAPFMILLELLSHVLTLLLCFFRPFNEGFYLSGAIFHFDCAVADVRFELLGYVIILIESVPSNDCLLQFHRELLLFIRYL